MEESDIETLVSLVLTELKKQPCVKLRKGMCVRCHRYPKVGLTNKMCHSCYTNQPRYNNRKKKYERKNKQKRNEKRRSQIYEQRSIIRQVDLTTNIQC